MRPFDEHGSCGSVLEERVATPTTTSAVVPAVPAGAVPLWTVEQMVCFGHAAAAARVAFGLQPTLMGHHCLSGGPAAAPAAAAAVPVAASAAPFVTLAMAAAEDDDNLVGVLLRLLASPAKVKSLQERGLKSRSPSRSSWDPAARREHGNCCCRCY